MKIDLTEAQYDALIGAIQISGTVYGVMGDMVDEKYQEPAAALDGLEHQVLEVAGEMGKDNIVEEFEGKRSIKYAHAEQFIGDLQEYEEFAMWDNLMLMLARRDLHEVHSEEDIVNMGEEEYYRKLFMLQEEYEQEFETNGVDRLRILKIAVQPEKESLPEGK